jgi:hypothetical protein
MLGVSSATPRDQTQIGIQSRAPTLERDAARARHGEKVAIQAGSVASSHGAVGAVGVEEVGEVDTRPWLRPRSGLACCSYLDGSTSRTVWRKPFTLIGFAW